ncbi:MAG TPA: retron Ec67 family RNA-directed DNA polymerase/endonuclease, partial [Candidatus Limnocylindrales bacterium]|nr:retron Ec67 family RNA-directed DNA polymerase/endonuclease [Candidatus Limnocylindrales bacterium]
MSRLESLRAAKSLTDIASFLNFKPAALSWILYRVGVEDKYQTFTIPKRSGGQRTIHAPLPALKRLQRNLASALQDCLEELAKEKKRNDRAAHGFVRDRSIVSNARQHRRRRWVFNLDLEEFFPSINFGRIRGYLIKNKDFQLDPVAATIVAQIACVGDSLPQGSPCSPVIANLIAHILDMRLIRLASKVGCTYSRYADDLTFSTNKSDFPQEIARAGGDGGDEPHVWLPGEAVTGMIGRSGFAINPKKTHIMYRSSRQEVTGLVVNEKISVRSEYRRSVRAMVHRLVTTGVYELVAPVQALGGAVVMKRAGTLDELHGMLGFIDSIDVFNGNEAPREEMTSAEKVYRRFLIYRIFYAAPAPVIVCEGETDNVYLTQAIRSLAAEFPELAEVTADNNIRIIPRIYKYRKSSTGRLIGLPSGGSGNLPEFIRTYRRESTTFSAPGLAQPVIVLFDNDSGSKPVWSIIDNLTRTKHTREESSVHVFKNVYAVPTPGKDSMIEDFFTAEARATRFEGKSFNVDE